MKENFLFLWPLFWLFASIYLYRKEWSSLLITIGGGFLVGTIAFIPAGFVANYALNTGHTSEKILSPAELRKEKIETQFSSWDGSHRKLESYLANRLNDPDSYEHIKTFYSDKESYIIVTSRYRAKNVFGALITGFIEVKVDIDGNILEVINTR